MTTANDAISSLPSVSLKEYAAILSSGMGKKFYPLNDLLSHEGNIKISSSTAIFNMGPASTCPSKKLGLCAAQKIGIKCYAQKAERKYRPLVLPYRMRQEKFWRNITAEQFVAQFLFINSLKKRKFNSIRMNESGDFWSQECVDKAEEIARLLSRFNIKVYCYTSRKDLDFRKCKHTIISGSGFKKKGISNEFRIVKNLKDRPKGFGICCGNCRICNRCLIRGRNTVVKSH